MIPMKPYPPRESPQESQHVAAPLRSDFITRGAQQDAATPYEKRCRMLRLHTFLTLCFAMLGMAQAFELRQTSVPVGILNQTTDYPSGATVTTLTAPLTNGNFTFVEWTLNGVRCADASGGAANPCVFTMTEQVDAVAIYLPTTEDADNDTLPDWWERRYFGSLQYNANDSPDGDLFPNSDELARQQHPGLANDHAHGGISRRRSESFYVIQDRATYGLLREISTPAGAVDQLRLVTKGAPINLTNPPSQTGGHHFTGWLLNGVRVDSGLTPQPLTVTPTADYTEYVARYVLDTKDADNDTVPDWREWLLFEGLQYNYSSDPDGDGFTWAEEDVRGFSTLVHNELVSGGLSRRRSELFYVDTTGRLAYRQNSNPATILEQTDYLPAGTQITVPSKENHTFANYKFSWWNLNGVRQEDPSGVGLPGFSFTLNTASTATANYIDPTVDTDNDGIKDWHEWTYYHTLEYGPSSDTDLDGFTYAQELERNQSPRVVNQLAPGGISRRRSEMFFVDQTGRLPLRLTSLPETILEQTDYYAPGTIVTLPEKYGHTYSNYRFGWWDLNGVRLEDASGAGESTWTFPLTVASTAVARYFDPTLDKDNDGILDWHEWVYYGNLDQGPSSDTDADGFTYAQELERQHSPRVKDEYLPGGISRRRSEMFAIDPVVEPTPPEIGDLLATNIGTTSATLRALVNPMSAATVASFEYGLSTNLGQQVNSESILNGFSSQPMDATLSGLQSNTVYYFRVIATNDFGVRTSVTGSFRTLPNLAGFEGWSRLYGVSGRFVDYDGDGILNVMEYAFGLNPTRQNQPFELPQPILFGDRWLLRYVRATNVTDVTIGAEWSNSLQSWSNISDAGQGTEHIFWTPANAGLPGSLFVRWKVW